MDVDSPINAAKFLDEHMTALGIIRNVLWKKKCNWRAARTSMMSAVLEPFSMNEVAKLLNYGGDS